MRINLPNFLSILRIIAIPFLVIIFYLPVSWSAWACALLFVLAAITDILDGYLARASKQITRLGTFIDPIADKLIVSVAIVLIAERADSWIVTLPALIIITREIGISGLRELMAELGLRDVVGVSYLGKLKTVAQMVAISLLLYENSIFWIPVFELGLVLLYLSVILTIWSMIIYCIEAKKSLRR